MSEQYGERIARLEEAMKGLADAMKAQAESTRRVEETLAKLVENTTETRLLAAEMKRQANDIKALDTDVERNSESIALLEDKMDARLKKVEDDHREIRTVLKWGRWLVGMIAALLGWLIQQSILKWGWVK